MVSKLNENLIMNLQIGCPHCAALNRVPEERLADGAKCGKCGNPLITGQPVEATDLTFANQAEKTQVPVVIDFWAPWCGPCQQFAPTFSQAAAELSPNVRLVKVNTEENPNLAARFGIRSIPTLLVMKNGQEVTRVNGAMPPAMFKQWVQQQLG